MPSQTSFTTDRYRSQHSSERTPNCSQNSAPGMDPEEVLAQAEQQWIFTDEELLRTPSICDGMSVAEERQLRQKGNTFITQVGIMLKLSQTTLTTASIFFNRFLMRRSLVPSEGYKPLHQYQVAATALFLATKVEETCRKIKELVIACCRVAQKNPNLLVDEQTKDYWRWRDTILISEDVLLEVLCFDLTLESPYKTLYDFLRYYNVHNNRRLRDAAWSFINDSNFSQLSLLFTSRTIACAALYCGAKQADVAFPDEQGRPWWEVQRVPLRDIRRAASFLANVYDNPSDGRKSQDNRIYVGLASPFDGSASEHRTRLKSSQTPTTPSQVERRNSDPASSLKRGRSDDGEEETNGQASTNGQSPKKRAKAEQDVHLTMTPANGALVNDTKENVKEEDAGSEEVSSALESRQVDLRSKDHWNESFAKVNPFEVAFATVNPFEVEFSTYEPRQSRRDMMALDGNVVNLRMQDHWNDTWFHNKCPQKCSKCSRQKDVPLWEESPRTCSTSSDPFSDCGKSALYCNISFYGSKGSLPESLPRLKGDEWRGIRDIPNIPSLPELRNRWHWHASREVSLSEDIGNTRDRDIRQWMVRFRLKAYAGKYWATFRQPAICRMPPEYLAESLYNEGDVGHTRCMHDFRSSDCSSSSRSDVDQPIDGLHIVGEVGDPGSLDGLHTSDCMTSSRSDDEQHIDSAFGSEDMQFVYNRQGGLRAVAGALVDDNGEYIGPNVHTQAGAGFGAGRTVPESVLAGGVRGEIEEDEALREPAQDTSGYQTLTSEYGESSHEAPRRRFKGLGWLSCRQRGKR